MAQRNGGPSDPAEVLLSDGQRLPAIGFGTYSLQSEEGVRAITTALEAGYRLIDSAVNYENEREVGQALKRSDVPRSDIRVTTKVPGRFHARHLAVESVEESLRRMDLDVLDLVLIHWPIPARGLYVEAWQGLVECRERGLVRSIGVSNFTPTHLDRIISATGVTPVVNQIEVHPLFPQEQMRAVNAELGIVTQAWSPLGKQCAPFAAGPVAGAAEKYRCTPAQVVLRWHREIGTLPLPKSADAARQRENLNIDGFTLTTDEVAVISSLGRPGRRLFGGDPDTFVEM